MKRNIKKIAVIGSGIMGSGIACHFANIGVEVLLLDIIPNALTEIEEKKGLTKKRNIIRLLEWLWNGTFRNGFHFFLLY